MLVLLLLLLLSVIDIFLIPSPASDTEVVEPTDDDDDELEIDGDNGERRNQVSAIHSLIYHHRHRTVVNAPSSIVPESRHFLDKCRVRLPFTHPWCIWGVCVCVCVCVCDLRLCVCVCV